MFGEDILKPDNAARKHRWKLKRNNLERGLFKEPYRTILY